MGKKGKARTLKLPPVHTVELSLRKWSDIFTSLANLQSMTGLPISVSNRLARIQRKLRTELETVNEAHQRRVKEFDDFDEKENRYSVPEKHQAAVRREYEEAMDEVVALKFRPVHVDDLEKLEGDDGTPANYGNIIVMLLDTVLVDDEEDGDEEQPEDDEPDTED